MKPCLLLACGTVLLNACGGAVDRGRSAVPPPAGEAAVTSVAVGATSGAMAPREAPDTVAREPISPESLAVRHRRNAVIDSIAARLTFTAGDSAYFAHLALTDSFPRITVGGCTGEGCSGAFPAKACSTVQVRRAPFDSTIAFSAGRGETLFVLSVPHLRAPGVVAFDTAYELSFALEDTLRFSAGDSLLLLEYVGEGYWAVWLRGRRAELDQFWQNDTRSPHRNPRLVRAMDVVRLWRITTRSGRVGWMLEDLNRVVPIGSDGDKWMMTCPGEKHWADP